MICGHSHVQRLIGLGEGVVIVNPGSVGLPAYEDDGLRPHIVESGSPHARYAMVELGPNTPPAVEFIAVAYDWRGASEQARQNGRPDWARALETGVMTP
jgi:diadenosine tetraphosphatase ApaH/serine/threonine PP2A family protein phosphatase